MTGLPSGPASFLSTSPPPLASLSSLGASQAGEASLLLGPDTQASQGGRRGVLKMSNGGPVPPSWPLVARRIRSNSFTGLRAPCGWLLPASQPCLLHSYPHSRAWSSLLEPSSPRSLCSRLPLIAQVSAQRAPSKRGSRPPLLDITHTCPQRS